LGGLFIGAALWQPVFHIAEYVSVAALDGMPTTTTRATSANGNDDFL